MANAFDDLGETARIKQVLEGLSHVFTTCLNLIQQVEPEIAEPVTDLLQCSDILNECMEGEDQDQETLKYMAEEALRLIREIDSAINEYYEDVLHQQKTMVDLYQYMRGNRNCSHIALTVYSACRSLGFLPGNAWVFKLECENSVYRLHKSIQDNDDSEDIIEEIHHFVKKYTDFRKSVTAADVLSWNKARGDLQKIYSKLVAREASETQPNNMEQLAASVPLTMVTVPTQAAGAIQSTCTVTTTTTTTTVTKSQSPLAGLPPGKRPLEKKTIKRKCGVCRKKVGLTAVECRCERIFCSVHRYSDKHDCDFDYRKWGAEQIAKDNPLVKGSKLRKL